MNLAGRVVIVTGASAGIGRATAVRLARANVDVVVTARRAERLDALVVDLTDEPGRRLAIPGDIGDPDFAPQLVEKTLNAFGRVDALVNNAGVGYKGSLAEMPHEAMRRLIDTNILGLLYVTQAVLPTMRFQRHGHIVNVSSIVGQRPLPDAALYAATKTAVNFLSRSLRLELAGVPIHVSTIYPGLTATEFAAARLGQKGGNRFGLRGVPADRVARRVLRTLRRPRPDVYITPLDYLIVEINRLFPRTTDAILGLVGRLAGKKQAANSN